MGRVGRIDDEPFCYLTTRGRRTGRHHMIEIWFAASPSGSTLYLLAGGRTDWVRNLMADAAVSVRVGRSGPEMTATARVLAAGDDEDALARRLVLQKYATDSTELAGWGQSALAVAIDL
ncbi:MAG TPA: nitroreductase/quinone reductase family protein [Acidimicrobiales bacterium]|nr:nitroreductase/quinone reductase family protein [Acidimicrobiales bacterium]